MIGKKPPATKESTQESLRKLTSVLRTANHDSYEDLANEMESFADSLGDITRVEGLRNAVSRLSDGTADSAIAPQNRMGLGSSWELELPDEVVQTMRAMNRLTRDKHLKMGSLEKSKYIKKVNLGTKGIPRSIIDVELEMTDDVSANYRTPGKISLGKILKQAGLDYKQIVEIYPPDGQKHTEFQRELVDQLNAKPMNVVFVLKEKPGWRKRLRGFFRRKQKISSKPCECYPCDCQMFCVKGSKYE